MDRGNHRTGEFMASGNHGIADPKPELVADSVQSEDPSRSGVSKTDESNAIDAGRGRVRVVRRRGILA